MKKKILDFLIKIGKKCKPLTYPVMIVVIAFLTIYHAIRNLFIKKENKWKSLVTGAICLVAVVGAVLVLPSLADEMTGESQTETVSEEELEPTMTPDVTVEPVVTEEPEEKQDSEETESAEETTKPEEEKKDEERRRMSHRQLRNRNISQQPNRMNPIICQKRKRRQLRKRGKRHRFS